ncbi:SIR2 family NAD-dependent protein deacylase [Helicobacter pylori]|uniref:SIR2 family NAD-dependent protein deacylase n=1 Tax=Helicobacter pylori TaxID=210 RepID=UPI00073D9249|nr:NAD-dependent deacylase [Helicobacter pylori]OKA00707.1 NAD-dependent deacylase [Helicobacter pylori]OKA02615.1 NAD-dependent deacylase [Helicobacter pylori]OMQ17517.1 NAD-dependent deacylase [Helicobacter pylori]OMQ17860.1 NAD-dependent deacylase [Helicobacter pylori]
MKNLVILSGAGISAESGIKTFRDADGLWEGHDIMEVASPYGWKKNPQKVLDFYNQRRRQLFEVYPNKAHEILAQLEKHYQVNIITQNVDDLHERAGSSCVLHLHGELLSVRSEKDPNLVYRWEKDLNLGDLAKDKSQLRPDIVWFGEAVPLLKEAISLVKRAHLLIIIGTSLQVYPAASLYTHAHKDALIYYIDPNAKNAHLPQNVQCINDNATHAMQDLMPKLIEMAS